MLFTVRSTLAMPPAVVGDLLSEAWRAWPNETGGVLLGISGARGSVVRAVIGPGPAAEHARMSFLPDTDWQRAEVARLWTTAPELEYLGDWHTHPGGSPGLSALDRKTLRSIAEYPDARQPRPVMLVLALSDDGGVRSRAERWARDRSEGVRIEVRD